MKIIKEDKFSIVWRSGDWVYKQQHEFLHRNELWCYQRMYPTGYVLLAEEHNRNTIKMPYVDSISHPFGWELKPHYRPILDALKFAGIRHGDLTKYALLFPVEDERRVYVIDFAESRLWDDPRPDKRPEGDGYWLHRTMREMSSE
jgi:RIO-like serine/threonine protein kinase